METNAPRSITEPDSAASALSVGLAGKDVPRVCPKCTCPHWNGSGFAAANAHRAWQDTDGTWYNGPAYETQTRSCAYCGWSQRIRKEHGKTVSIESDELPANV